MSKQKVQARSPQPPLISQLQAATCYRCTKELYKFFDPDLQKLLLYEVEGEQVHKHECSPRGLKVPLVSDLKPVACWKCGAATHTGRSPYTGKQVFYDVVGGLVQYHRPICTPEAQRAYMARQYRARQLEYKINSEFEDLIARQS